ncbi:hypothetical protein TCSYLVIO_002074 [Trypanosoma cruzi]|nr:hypothetical protein TCSYLVIO_002074 [Trypanosoma cruzi]
MSPVRTSVVTGGGALRLLRSIHLPCAAFHRCGFSSRGCRRGVLSVPVEDLTPKSIALFHSYGPPKSGTVPVVTDTTAFTRILNEVLVRDDSGANDVIRDLRRFLRQKREELAPLLAEKHRIEAVVDNRYVPLLGCLVLAFLVTQFVVLFRWVFIVFDWNLVEPMTYFLGYTVVWAGIVFHCYYARELTWETMLDTVAHRRRVHLYEKAGIDVKKVERLQREVCGIERMLSKYGLQ